MADQSNLRSMTGYRSDDGNVYKISAKTAFTAQAKLGEVPLVGTEAFLPKGYKRRFTTAHNAANNISRKFTLYSLGSPMQTAGGSITALHEIAGVDTAIPFVASGAFTSEVRPRRL